MKYSQKFSESAGKGPSAEKIRNSSQQLKTPSYKYARAVCVDMLGLSDPTEIDNKIYIAAPKSEESINRKANVNYDGDRSRIKDGARLTIFTDTPEELEKLIKAYSYKGLQNNDFHKTMQKRSGYTFHEDPKNYVTKTKRWGYAALYTVMEYGRNGDTFEVQIYPRSMKDIYTKTHELYEQVRASGNLERWENAYKEKSGSKEPKLSDFLTAKELMTMKEILRLHEAGLKAAGVFHLIEKFPVIDDLPALVREPDIIAYPQDFMGPPMPEYMDQSFDMA